MSIYLLAASMKAWYSPSVKSGSGSSRKNSLRTPVISLISVRFSSELRFKVSMSTRSAHAVSNGYIKAIARLNLPFSILARSLCTLLVVPDNLYKP